MGESGGLFDEECEVVVNFGDYDEFMGYVSLEVEFFECGRLFLFMMLRGNVEIMVCVVEYKIVYWLMNVVWLGGLLVGFVIVVWMV